jgi:hypothetical protein
MLLQEPGNIAILLLPCPVNKMLKISTQVKGKWNLQKNL